MTLLALCAFAAQPDVVFDLTSPIPVSANHVTTTYGGVTFDYVKAMSPNSGAFLYSNWDSYMMTITSPAGKKITAIEFDGLPNQSNPSQAAQMVVVSGGGTLEHNAGGTSVWQGEGSTTLVFNSASSSVYTIQRMRIWFAGSAYEPGTGNASGEGSDDVILERTLVGYPIARPLSVPQDGQAVRMAIVTIRRFAPLAQEYALWKTQQGYEVTEVYADDYMDASLGYDANARRIQARLREIHPTFVLIMGDYEHVPAFDGTKSYKQNYVTDYFYGEYTGDYFPEAYVGRFSCYDEADLRHQMEKTQYMAMLSADQGSWLNTSVGLHNPAPDIPDTYKGYNYTMDYLRRADATIRETSASSPDKVNEYINQGCATLTYYGHGLTGSFNTTYTISEARKLQNRDKYPLMLSMSCLTGQFDNGNWRSVLCLAEQMQRMEKAGSVAFLGATRESGSHSNNYFMTGGEKNGQTYPGFMASMFPFTDQDPLNFHARTLGEGVAMGSFSINCFLQTNAENSTEWWELFGDPTYQPYIQSPKTMEVRPAGPAMAGHLLRVKAAPHAVVCISRDRHIWAVGLTNDKGYVTLKIDREAVAGEAILYASAPGFTDWRDAIQIAPNDGQEEQLPRVTQTMDPVLTDVDVIDHYTANTVAEWYKNVTITGQSGAVYATCVAGDYNFECVKMRDNYDPCGIVTTSSRGFVRKVAIDWTHPSGNADRITVYGSNTPYTNTTDVWYSNRQGQLLGQLVKGQKDSIIITDNYVYVALRAENPDCMMQSIRIGWGTAEFDVEGSDHPQPSTFDFDDFKRHRVLVEKFSGQDCDSDDAILDAYATDTDLEHKMYELRHYTHTRDSLCMSAEPYDVMRRPWGISAYPSYLVDRCGYDGATYAYCGFVTSAQAIKDQDWVCNRYDRPCRVSLTLDGSTYNPATRELKIVVSGKALPELVDLRLSLFVAQNGIQACQAGAGSSYVHNGVSRVCLTDNALGDRITLRGDGVFQVEKTYTLPRQIGYLATDADQMDIVAFVSSWDDYAYPPRDGNADKDYEKSEVHNTVTSPIRLLPFRALAPTLPQDDSIIPGDVNGDRLVNLDDLKALLNIVLGKEKAPKDASAADLNSDGRVQVGDCTRLIQMILSATPTAP